MIITPQAMQQADRAGIRSISKLAQEAFIEKPKTYSNQKVSVYLGSLRRQHGHCAIHIYKDIVFLFRGELLFQVYPLPETLRVVEKPKTAEKIKIKVKKNVNKTQ